MQYGNIHFFLEIYMTELHLCLIYMTIFPDSILMDRKLSRLGQLNEWRPSGDLIDCQVASGGSYELVWYSGVCNIVKYHRIFLQSTIWYSRGGKWHLRVGVGAKHRQITLPVTSNTDSITRESYCRVVMVW